MGFLNDWRILAFCRALLGLFEAGEFSTFWADARRRERWLIFFFLFFFCRIPPRVHLLDLLMVCPI